MNPLKIFESETIQFLQQLEHSSVDIATLQRKALKQYVLNRLQVIHNRIDEEEFDLAKDMLEDSPAGDDMGCHNRYIRFDVPEHEDMDIQQVIDLLIELRHSIEHPESVNHSSDKDDLPF
jgi:hypothetical protein